MSEEIIPIINRIFFLLIHSASSTIHYTSSYTPHRLQNRSLSSLSPLPLVTIPQNTATMPPAPPLPLPPPPPPQAPLPGPPASTSPCLSASMVPLVSSPPTSPSAEIPQSAILSSLFSPILETASDIFSNPFSLLPPPAEETTETSDKIEQKPDVRQEKWDFDWGWEKEGGVPTPEVFNKKALEAVMKGMEIDGFQRVKEKKGWTGKGGRKAREEVAGELSRVLEKVERSK